MRLIIKNRIIWRKIRVDYDINFFAVKGHFSLLYFFMFYIQRHSNNKNNKMFKTEIIDSISKKTGNTKVAAEAMLNAFVDTIIEAIKKGQDVSLIGFGSFKVVKTKAKTGRNPRTGKEIKIPAGKKVKFTIGKTLKESVKK